MFQHLWSLELSNVLAKKIPRGELTRAEGDDFEGVEASTLCSVMLTNGSFPRPIILR